MFSKVGEAAERYPEFVAEIQVILRQHNLPVATPDAIPALADRFVEPGHLRDDLISMVNALCYQEPGTTTLDLMGLLLVAAAGPAANDDLAASPATEEPVRRLFNALVEARRSRQAEDEADLARAEASPDDSFSTTADPAVGPLPGPLQGHAPEHLDRPAPAAPPPPPSPASRGSVLARALALSADEHDPRNNPESAPATSPTESAFSTRIIPETKALHGTQASSPDKPGPNTRIHPEAEAEPLAETGPRPRPDARPTATQNGKPATESDLKAKLRPNANPDPRPAVAEKQATPAPIRKPLAPTATTPGPTLRPLDRIASASPLFASATPASKRNREATSKERDSQAVTSETANSEASDSRAADDIRPKRPIPGWAFGLGGIVLGLLLGILLYRQFAPRVPTATSPGAETAPASDANAAPGSAAYTGSDNSSQRSGHSNAGSQPARSEGSFRNSRTGSSSRTGRGTSSSTGTAPYTASSARSASSSADSSPTPTPNRSATFGTPAPPPVRSVDLNPPADDATTPRASVRVPNVVTGASGTMAANLISAPAPIYPIAAAAAKVQGEVIIQAVVDRDGNVSEARIVSGPPMLRNAALDAVRRWHFRPFLADGSPAEIGTTARIQFHLNQ